MKIIERHIAGKNAAAACEDGIIVTPHFAAVIDGSTSKTPLHIHHDCTNGRFCMMLISEYVASMPPDISLEAFLHGITQHIRRQYETANISMQRLDSHTEERLTASAAIYSQSRQQVWLVGDCQCLVGGILHDNPKPQEAHIAAKRAAFLHQVMQQGTTADDIRRHDIGRDHIVADIIEGSRRQNIDYAVIDGFPIYQQGVKTISVTPGDEVVLATDGYPVLCPTLQATEHALAQLLHDDPLLIHHYQATKAHMHGNNSFDDRAYLRVVADDTEVNR